MIITDFILNFPVISERNDRYNLYSGLVAGLNTRETLDVLGHCLDQEVLKRKVILNKIIFSAANWTMEENDQIFIKVYELINQLTSYFKKESASMILMEILPYISKGNKDKLVNDFSLSKYKNNRRRIYRYLYEHWTPNYEVFIKKAWTRFMDESSIKLIIEKMPNEFLIKNFDELLLYFDDEYLNYDYFVKRLRNKLYSRLYDEIPSKIQALKKKDPISYIFIMKEHKVKLNVNWAIEIYKNYSHSRFLARWYSEMNLWPDIFKEYPDFLSEISDKHL